MLFNGCALIFTFSGTQVRIVEIERLQSLFKMSMVFYNPVITDDWLNPCYTSCLAARVSQSSREQLAIAEFANALLVIPKQLAVNAAQDSADLVAKLRAYHNTSQTIPAQSHLKW